MDRIWKVKCHWIYVTPEGVQDFNRLIFTDGPAGREMDIHVVAETLPEALKTVVAEVQLREEERHAHNLIGARLPANHFPNNRTT